MRVRTEACLFGELGEHVVGLDVQQQGGFVAAPVSRVSGGPRAPLGWRSGKAYGQKGHLDGKYPVRVLRDFVAKNGHETYPGRRPLADSRINRDGLPAGSPAPVFRLPRLDGIELSLEQYRGKRMLLVFSDPGCGPCDELAPALERLHRGSPDLQILMVSRGGQEANRRKVAAHQLTFPVVLQKKWEISRKYGMFAMPIAFLIDEQGVTAADVAVGGPAIISLAASPHTLAECGKDEYIELQRLQKRLDVLRKELGKGQERLQGLAREQASTRDTVLRISGAAQVLEELLADRSASDADSPASPPQAVTAVGSKGQLMTSGD